MVFTKKIGKFYIINTGETAKIAMINKITISYWESFICSDYCLVGSSKTCLICNLDFNEYIETLPVRISLFMTLNIMIKNYDSASNL